VSVTLRGFGAVSKFKGRKWPLFEKSGAEIFAILGLKRRKQHGPKA
jgi:hypothetical protein